MLHMEWIQSRLCETKAKLVKICARSFFNITRGSTFWHFGSKGTSSILGIYIKCLILPSSGFMEIKYCKTIREFFYTSSFNRFLKIIYSAPRQKARYFIWSLINTLSKLLVKIKRIPQTFIFGDVVRSVATFLRQTIHVIGNLNEFFIESSLLYLFFMKF